MRIHRGHLSKVVKRIPDGAENVRWQPSIESLRVFSVHIFPSCGSFPFPRMGRFPRALLMAKLDSTIRADVCPSAFLPPARFPADARHFRCRRSPGSVKSFDRDLGPPKSEQKLCSHKQVRTGSQRSRDLRRDTIFAWLDTCWITCAS